MTTIEGHKLKISLKKYTVWAALENAQGFWALNVSVMPLSLAYLPGRERVRNDRHLQGRTNLPLVEEKPGNEFESPASAKYRAKPWEETMPTGAMCSSDLLQGQLWQGFRAG